MTKRSLAKDKNLYVIFSITLMGVLGVSSITPAFPKIIEHFGISASEVGLLVTAFTLPGVFLTPIYGVLADRVGRKRIVVPSLFLFALAGAACGFVDDFTALLALRFLQGVGAASLGSINSTLIGDLYAGKTRVKAMGYNASVLSVAVAAYPSIGGALALVGWNYPFFLPVLAVPIGFIVLFVLKNPEPKSEQSLSSYFANTFKKIQNKKIIGLFLNGVLTFIVLYGSIITFMPILIERRLGFSSFGIGLFLSALSITTAVVSWKLGALSRRFTKGRLLVAAYSFFIVSQLAIAVIDNTWLLLFAVMIFGLGHGLGIPIVQTLMAELAPLEYRGAFMSLNGMFLRIGQTLGPLIMALVYGYWGLSAVYIAAAGFSVLLLLITVFMIGKTD